MGFITKARLCLIVDFSEEKYKYWRAWFEVWRSVRDTPIPDLPEPKIFKPKHPGLLVLPDYGRSLVKLPIKFGATGAENDRPYQTKAHGVGSGVCE